MDYKVCSRCEKSLPATREFFHVSKRTKDGLYSHCKECRDPFAPTITKEEEDREERIFKKSQELGDGWQTPILTGDEENQIGMLYGKAIELGKNWQVDHIIPIEWGGLHHPDNLYIVYRRPNEI